MTSATRTPLRPAKQLESKVEKNYAHLVTWPQRCHYFSLSLSVICVSVTLQPMHAKLQLLYHDNDGV